MNVTFTSNPGGCHDHQPQPYTPSGFSPSTPRRPASADASGHPDNAQIDRFIESERAWRNEVDFEYLRKTLTLPDTILPGLAVDQLTEAQRADVTDWGRLAHG
ncbi:hypothetical protein AB1285_27345 [Microbacterium sp. NRRL B-14842]|uniref:hypothetical protein n=1 Tax=Microbacterium sp. NRRL B-14842 TaxID=3162881 RepID=UPI003D2783AE